MFKKQPLHGRNSKQVVESPSGLGDPTVCTFFGIPDQTKNVGMPGTPGTLEPFCKTKKREIKGIDEKKIKIKKVRRIEYRFQSNRHFPPTIIFVGGVYPSLHVATNTCFSDRVMNRLSFACYL